MSNLHYKIACEGTIHMPLVEHEKVLPLYRKVLLFSFFITFIIVAFTAGTVFVYQSDQMKAHLTDRARAIASLWGVTIPSADVEEIIKTQTDSAKLKNLKTVVTNLMKKTPDYLNGNVVIVNKLNGNQFRVISLSEENAKSFNQYTANRYFLQAYDEAVAEKTLASSQIYSENNKTWLTAFQPIYGTDGSIIAFLAANVSAEMFKSYKQKIGLYLIFSLLVVTSIVYLILRWGLKKVFEPVQEIISGINSVSAGNFKVRIRISDQPDLAKLADNFNQMTEQLSLLFDRLSDTYKEFGAEPSRVNNAHKIEDAIGEMEKIIAKTKIQKELQRAEKMNAIGQLAASVAHEIRNPMTVVRGFLQIFLAKDHMSKEELIYIQLMIDELNRAEMIINDFLSLAKPDLDQIEKVEASELASKVMDLMNTFALMSKNISLEMNVEHDVYVKGNQGELKQVLINIVKNGIEAMKMGGDLTLNVKKTERYGLFEISDTGIGMTPEELSRLGTAFYSLKEKGTGIGLMVCYQIVENMKGYIEVESTKGKGTVFRLYIPLWEERTD